VVILAALANALTVVKKRFEEVKVVVNGLGAAGLACCEILLAAGVQTLVGVDRLGIALAGSPERLREARKDLPSITRYDQPSGSLQDALRGADVLIGLSVGNIVKPEDLDLMSEDRVVFAMANPDPEIAPDLAMPRCRVFATGRSDYPNQINNVLSFPGLFRGALDVQATDINEAMMLAAAEAIARMIPFGTLSEDYIIPSVFDKQVVPHVAKAVSAAALRTGVARKTDRSVNSNE
jgi:malate dehydrogenase (oxaloacetate-decarboxylating)